MKIARIETFLFDPGTAKNLLFCRVETDSGLHGWGEAYVTPGKEPVIEHLLQPHGQIHDRPQRVQHPPHGAGDVRRFRHAPRLAGPAVGVERDRIALWDIVAKHANLPLYNLLGGASRERVKVYANGWSSGSETIEQNVERALQGEGDGIHRAEMGSVPRALAQLHPSRGRGPRRALRAGDARALGPDFTLLVEAHRRLAPMHAIRIGRRIAEFDIGWYEEPCLCDNIELVAEVRRALPGVPIVTGEAIYSKEAFAQALAARAADIINPDICNCGGLSAMLDIAAMAQPHAVAVAPHNYNSTLVGLAATVQLSAMIPELLDRRVLHQPEAGLRRDRGGAAGGAGQLRRTAHHAGPWHRHRRGKAARPPVPRHGHPHGQGAAILHGGVSAQELRRGSDPHRVLIRRVGGSAADGDRPATGRRQLRHEACHVTVKCRPHRPLVMSPSMCLPSRLPSNVMRSPWPCTAPSGSMLPSTQVA